MTGATTERPPSPVIAKVTTNIHGARGTLELGTSLMVMGRDQADAHHLDLVLERSYTLPVRVVSRKVKLPNGVSSPRARSRYVQTYRSTGDRSSTIHYDSIEMSQKAASILAWTRVGRIFMTTGAREHANPATIRAALKPAFSFSEDGKTSHLKQHVSVLHDQIFILGVNDVAMHLSQTGYRCYFEIDNPAKLDITNIIRNCDWYTDGEDPRVNAIDVYPTELHPEDVDELWFRQIASALVDVRLKARIFKGLDHAAHSFGGHAHVHINGLTAAVMTMKAYGDVRSFAKVVALSPVIIATDFRVFRMGQALGSRATMFLIQSIFDELGKKDYVTTQTELLYAVTDIIVSHLARNDHQKHIRTNYKAVDASFAILMDIKYTGDLGNLQKFANFAALRDGVRYGAPMCYAKDDDDHNEESVKVLDAFLDASASTVLGATMSTGIAGAAGGAVGSSILTFVKTLGGVAIDHRWEKGQLIASIQSRFHSEITAPAGHGTILGVKIALTGDQKTIATQYAADAESVMNTVSVRVSPKALALEGS